MIGQIVLKDEDSVGSSLGSFCFEANIAQSWIALVPVSAEKLENGKMHSLLVSKAHELPSIRMISHETDFHTLRMLERALAHGQR